jgi:hypothetical protein
MGLLLMVTLLLMERHLSYSCKLALPTLTGKLQLKKMLQTHLRFLLALLTLLPPTILIPKGWLFQALSWDASAESLTLSGTGGLTVSSDSGGPVYLQDSNATATYNISELSNNAGNFNVQMVCL